MTIQVSGVLKDPSNNVSSGTRIRVSALENEGDTLLSLDASVVTGSDGSYSFELVNGKHSIEVNFAKKYFLVGTVTITDDTPSNITLPALLDLTATT